MPQAFEMMGWSTPIAQLDAGIVKSLPGGVATFEQHRAKDAKKFLGDRGP